MSHVPYIWIKWKSGPDQTAISSVPDEVHIPQKGILGVQVTT